MDRRERLEQRLQLLTESLEEATDPSDRRSLREEILAVHRHLDEHESGWTDAAIQDVAGQEPQARRAESNADVTAPALSTSGPVLPFKQAKPGFYPDPFSRRGYERHFDGTTWGDGTHPAGGPKLADLQENTSAPTWSAPLHPRKPGFYPDPFTSEGYQRYYDGQQWSNSTHPTGGPSLEQLAEDPPAGIYPDPYSSGTREWLGHRWKSDGRGSNWGVILTQEEQHATPPSPETRRA